MRAAVLVAAGMTLAVGAAPPAQADPRPAVPDTFVPVQTSRFPVRATRACRDNTRTLRVPTARFPSIGSALTAARPGSRIRVGPGDYRENPAEWFSLAIATDDVCLLGAGRRTRLIAARGQKYGVLLTGNHVVIRGMSIRGFEASIALGRDDGRTQRKVTLQRLRIQGGRARWSEGIVAYPDHRSTAGRPVLDGLLLDRVRVRGVNMGVSCNAGPCEHWWLHRVRIRSRGSDGDSGADAFAIESGRQIVVTRSLFAGAGGDGIDTKASDVVVQRCSVRQVQRNAIKLWRGGDVAETTIDGSGADAALVGADGGRYRYRRISVTHHDPGGTGYVGTWGYDTQEPVRLAIRRSSFARNSSGGLYVPATAGTRIRLVGNSFADRGSTLIDVGGSTVLTTPSGLAMIANNGWGRGNHLG